MFTTSPVARQTLLLFSIVLSVMLCASNARADWSGYINTETFVDQQYGYMSVGNADTVVSAVRLVCFPPVGFRLYIDKRLFPDATVERINMGVDRLDPHRIDATTTSTEYVVSESYPRFWDLIAQMVAGAKVRVRPQGEDNAHQFSLTGFGSAYKKACGWMPGWDGYLAHLDDYQ